MSQAESYRVLFVCTHNAARSIMAEAILKRIGSGTFTAHSAGVQPTATINPYVRALLNRDGVDTGALEPKSWTDFAGPDAPALDFVFTLCDTTAGEACPTWPGQPLTAHWPFPDPAYAQGSEAEIMAFVADIYRQIYRRLSVFVSLPIASLDRLSLQARVQDIHANADGSGPDTSGRA